MEQTGADMEAVKQNGICWAQVINESYLLIRRAVVVLSFKLLLFISIRPATPFAPTNAALVSAGCCGLQVWTRGCTCTAGTTCNCRQAPAGARSLEGGLARGVH